MTKDSDFKTLVRQRMATTGESYTLARTQLYRPPEGPGLPLARRVFGLKTRYRVAYLGDGDQPGDGAAQALFGRVIAWGRASNVFLENGARLCLVDDGSGALQPAYSTPECDSLVELVVHERAGDAILGRLAASAEARLAAENHPARIAVERPEAAQSEYYLVSAAVTPERYLNLLEPFLATRWIYGAAVPRSVPTAGLANGAFADDATYRRLRINGSDPNLSQLATFLKVGATEQILRLAEAGVSVRLDHRRFTPATEAVLAQRAYLDAARQLRGRRPQDAVVLEAWKAALDDIELRGRAEPWCDWVLREHTGKFLGQLRPPSPMRESLGPAVMSIASESEVARAVDTAPCSTRASLRGRFIATAKAARRDFTVDWVHLKLNDQTQRTLRCWDPLDAEDEGARRLIESISVPSPPAGS